MPTKYADWSNCAACPLARREPRRDCQAEAAEARHDRAERSLITSPNISGSHFRQVSGGQTGIAQPETGKIEVPNSEASLRALSARYGINKKTSAKWRKRTSVADLPTGRKDAKSTVLTLDEEAIIVAFRRQPSCLAA